MRTSPRGRNRSCAVAALSSLLLLLSACSSDSSAPVSYRVYPANGGPNITEAVKKGEETLSTIRFALEQQLPSLTWQQTQHFPQLQPCRDEKAPEGFVTDSTSAWIGKIPSIGIGSINWAETVMPAVGQVLANEGFPLWNTSGTQWDTTGTPYTVYHGVTGDELTFTRFTDGVMLVLKTGCYRRTGTK